MRIGVLRKMMMVEGVGRHVASEEKRSGGATVDVKPLHYSLKFLHTFNIFNKLNERHNQKVYIITLKR